jgi:hypothetical protein
VIILLVVMGSPVVKKKAGELVSRIRGSKAGGAGKEMA